MLKHTGTHGIKTERLTLRKFKPEDSYGFYLCCKSEKVNKYVTYPIHKSEEETKIIIGQWIDSYKSEKTYNWVIEFQGIAIGNICVVSQDETQCELGWQIGEEYWNKGIMTEAAKAVVDFLFEEGFETVKAGHHIDNIGSGRVMQKIGMLKEKEIHGVALKNSGDTYTQICYKIERKK